MRYYPFHCYKPPIAKNLQRAEFVSENLECLDWSGAAESNRESSAPKADMLTITPAPALLIYQMIFPKSKVKECDIM